MSATHGEGLVRGTPLMVSERVDSTWLDGRFVIREVNLMSSDAQASGGGCDTVRLMQRQKGGETHVGEPTQDKLS